MEIAKTHTVYRDNTGDILSMAKRRKERAIASEQRGVSSKSGNGPGTGTTALGALVWLANGMPWNTVLEWLKTLALAGGLALTARWAIGEPYKIPSGSMEPTLHGDARFLRGDRVFVNKWIYGLRFPFNHARIPFLGKPLDYASRRIFRGATPKRWEIVVFKSVEKNAKHGTLVKRIVGLPGERVQIREGKIYINGEPLTLPDSMPNIYYTREGRYGVLTTDEFSLIPPDHYFVLGDNSSASRDGRYWGWVPNEHILGRVSCIAWPPNRWRDFTGFSRTWWWRCVLVVLSLFLVWRLFLGQSFPVLETMPDGDFAPGDHLYIDRVVFGIPIPFVGLRLTRGRPPKRGELVLYRVEIPGQGKTFLLGRVAGLPGERILIKNGTLTVDGRSVESFPFNSRLEEKLSGIVAPYGRSTSKEYSVVPSEHVFVLSVQNDGTRDSRALGWIPFSSLVGVARAVWWSPRRWRILRSG